MADTHAHDIKVFSDDGKLLKVIGKRGEGDGEFNFPTHMTFAADKLYVTDTLNSRVQIFDPDGNMIRKFGKLGLYVGDLVRPKGVTVDSANNIYVIESLYDNLLVYDSQGRTLLGVGGGGKRSANSISRPESEPTAMTVSISPTCTTAESRCCNIWEHSRAGYPRHQFMTAGVTRPTAVH